MVFDLQDAFEDDPGFQEIHSPFTMCNPISSNAREPPIMSILKVKHVLGTGNW